ncbi:Fanconi anemia group J protein-like [Dorcoceras hygrometricum]|uniref:Fanconi anemia group J protein-like n=1 Tax=Dorcoceras hygrometricum TaxID=472368 RepID=A0A2Z7AQ59_9LAMI|nr:Fanconi anemia group J protein-like [Dorcoceras hygrometricum]
MPPDLKQISPLGSTNSHPDLTTSVPLATSDLTNPRTTSYQPYATNAKSDIHQTTPYYFYSTRTHPNDPSTTSFRFPLTTTHSASNPITRGSNLDTQISLKSDRF